MAQVVKCQPLGGFVLFCNGGQQQGFRLAQFARAKFFRPGVVKTPRGFNHDGRGQRGHVGCPSRYAKGRETKKQKHPTTEAGCVTPCAPGYNYAAIGAHGVTRPACHDIFEDDVKRCPIRR